MTLIRDLGTMFPTSTSKERKRFGLYLCPSCKSEFKMIASDVKRRKTKMCKSCSITIAKTTHGFTKTPLHSVWCGIRARCYLEKNDDYKYYGGIGVKMCKEWYDDFLVFRKWCIDNNHKKGMHISRRGDTGNYEPSNCVIVTKKQNVGERNTLYAKKQKIGETIC